MKDTSIGVLLHDRLERFYANNNSKIQELKKKRSMMNHEFLEFDENNLPIIEEKEGKRYPKLKEEIRRKEYTDKMTALMDTKIQIEI